MKQKIALVAFVGILFFWKNPSAQTEQFPTVRYEIFDEVREGDSNKTKAALRIIVAGELSRSSLHKVLRRAQADVEAQVRSENQRMHLVIWAYVSKLHAQSQELWLARLKQTEKTPPQIQFNENQLKLLSRPPERKFGLSEEERKTLWQTMQTIHQQAQQTAMERFPLEAKNFKEAGQFFRLSERSPLLLAEPFAVDPPAEMTGAVSLAEQTTLQLLHSIFFQGRAWHYVEAKPPLEETLQVGWMDSLNLLRQEHLPDEAYEKKIQTLAEDIQREEQKELAGRVGLSLQQLEDIGVEGILKNWPLPGEAP